ncbi:MAG: shikimate dehydrogenase, partial [Bacteroidia bacterium]|nr:shikimate dehydrogenase [Bacteroidia bacterium]
PLLKPEYKKALILGNGGASKAVQVALKNLDIPYSIVSRSGQLYYNDVSVKTIADHQIIINTTPLGMFPDSNSYPPIPYESISNKHLAYDLVYNPDKTVFLEKCEAKGATIKGGLEMLHLQAERSWDIFKM